MKMRYYNIYHSFTESGLSCGGFTSTSHKEKYHATAQIIPTVANIRGYIKKHFPGKEIEETWMSVKEQITDGLKYGSFTIAIKAYSNKPFVSESIAFEELF